MFRCLSFEKIVYPELSRRRQGDRAAPPEEGEPDARSQGESHLTTLHLRDKHPHSSPDPTVPQRHWQLSLERTHEQITFKFARRINLTLPTPGHTDGLCSQCSCCPGNLFQGGKFEWFLVNWWVFGNRLGWNCGMSPEVLVCFYHTNEPAATITFTGKLNLQDER